MNDYTTYLDQSTTMLSNWWISLKDILLQGIMILAYIVACWLIFKLVTKVATRLLNFSYINKINDLYKNIDFLNRSGIVIDIKQILLFIIKAVLLLIFVIVGADLFHFTGVTVIVNNIINYLPKLISGIAIILAGIYLANKVKTKLANMQNLFGQNSAMRIVSNIAVFGILFFFVLLGLNQAGIDTSIISNNINIIIGMLFASIALAFGLGSKNIVQDILYSYYLRKNLEIGAKIQVIDDNISGTVIAIDGVSVKLSTDQGIIIYSTKQLMNLKIQIIHS